MSGWKPIDTAPRDGSQFLVTDWELGDPWSTTIELVNGPALSDGRILNQNSGNYARLDRFTYWMPVPKQPVEANGDVEFT